MWYEGIVIFCYSATNYTVWFYSKISLRKNRIVMDIG